MTNRPSQKSSHRGCAQVAWALFPIIAAALVISLFRWIAADPQWSGYEVWILSMSAATCIMYGLDKFLAGSNLRVPENLLLLMTILGGGIGALIAILLFWHKVRKPWFFLIAWLGSIVQVAFGFWLTGVS